MANRRRVGLPWRRDPEVLARIQQVGRLWLARRTNMAIAAELGVSEHTVREDVKRWNLLWQEYIQEDRAVKTADILAELDDTRARALAAAEFDEQCERAVLYGLAVVIDGQPRMVYRDAKGSAQFRGNKAAAIGQARQASMDKAKLLGLVVDKAALTDSDGQAVDLAAIVLAARTARSEAEA